MSDIVMSAVYEQAAVCAAVGYSMENCYIRRAEKTVRSFPVAAADSEAVDDSLRLHSSTGRTR